jgi:hypothetical protein
LAEQAPGHAACIMSMHGSIHHHFPIDLLNISLQNTEAQPFGQLKLFIKFL